MGQRTVTDEDDDGNFPDQYGSPASIGRNVFQMMTSQSVTWVLATGLAIVVPRYLGPSLHGTVRLGQSLWAIAGILVAVGTSRALQVEIARDRSLGLGLVGPTLVIRTIAFAVCASGLGVYAVFISDDRTLAGVVAILGVGALLSTWSETISAAFVGLEQMSTPAVVQAIWKLLNFAGVLLLIRLGGDVYGIVGMGVAASAVALVILLRRFRLVLRVELRHWRRSAPKIIADGFPFMLNDSAVVLYQQIDVIVVSWVAGSQDIGWYATAELLAGSLVFPVTVITVTIFPTLARLHFYDPDGFTHLVQRTFSRLTMVAVPIGLGTILVAPRFAPLLFGEDFRETGPVLAIFGPLIILTFGTILFANVALATGRVRSWVLLVLASALATIPLDLILVPWSRDRYGNGAIGAALAQVMTETAQFAVGVWLVAPFLIRRDIVWRLARVLGAGGIMFSVGWPIRQVFLPAIVLICAVVYCLALVILRVIEDDDRRLIGKALRRVGVGSSW